MPRVTKQLNAEENVGKNHSVDYSEDEKCDSCSEAKGTVDANCLYIIKTTPSPTTKKRSDRF